MKTIQIGVRNISLNLPITKTLSLSQGKAVITIDPFNQRIKILECSGDISELMNQLQPLYEKYGIGKIFHICEKSHVTAFVDQGFIVEAEVEQFLTGSTGYFVSLYVVPERQKSQNTVEEDSILCLAANCSSTKNNNQLSQGYEIRTAVPEDIHELSTLYNTVFSSYPFPMNDPMYIKKMMESSTLFKVILHNNKIISAASAEMDIHNNSAEMTDCATFPAHRGKGLMHFLLQSLEEEMIHRNFQVLYTIARARSHGMNIVFAKNGYTYKGRLINNCHICGQFEDMNVWAKSIG